MADITITCPRCKAHSQVSEYAASPVPCPSCGQPVFKPEHRRSENLKIKPEPVGGPLPSNADETSRPVRSADWRERQTARRARPARQRRLDIFVAGLVFVITAGVLIGWQYRGRSDPKLLELYYSVRWLAIGAIWLAVLIAAFADSRLQGFLCLGIPPYQLFFALNRLDSSVLRSLFFAALLALLAEYCFIPPDRTLLGLVQQEIVVWLQAGHNWIHSLGREPV